MTRKLLPYEYDLIQQLGVTEDEYLAFIEVQFNYELSAAERIAKPQCEPVSLAFAAVAAGTATFGQTLIVAAVLIAPGILFQVAAMLLTPKPSLPAGGGNNRAREQRFSPRFGFNSSQELGQYGDPINLVYCNTSHNPIGGVRIGTSLVWSSVESYGSTQFMQLLLVLGAANVKTIDYDRVAFGQLPLGQFSAANTWLYYEDNGPVNFNDKVLGDGKDPTRDGADSAEDVCRVMFAKNRRDGYSQAFSPSSLTSVGVYDPIPLNVEIQERRSSGRPQWRPLQVTIQGDNYGTGNNVRYGIGNTITVIFGQARRRQDKVAQEAAKEMRYQLVSALDQAATYMLGTAKFKLVSVTDNTNLDDNEVRAKFECIEPGRRPVTDYDRVKVKLWSESDRELIEEGKEKLKDTATEGRFTGPDFLRNQPGKWAFVQDVTDLDDYTYTLPYGRLSSGTLAADGFTAAPDNVSSGDFVVPLKAFGGDNWDFTGNKVITWRSELDQQRTATIPKGGSIAVTRAILESFLANKPKLDVGALRDEIEDDLERIRQLKDDVDAGSYDRNFRGEAKRAVAAIDKRIDELEDKIDDKVRDASDLNKKTTTISGQKVLKDNTNLDKRNTGIGRLQNEIKRLKDDKQDILSDNVSRSRSGYTSFLRYADFPFTGIDGNRYGSGGIRAMKRRLARLKGQTTTDQIGVKAVRDYLKDLIRDKEEALNLAKSVSKDWEDLAGAGDDDFFTKCLVKIESAAYQTVTACDYVRFAIRCKLFRRVSGRAKDYGQNEAPDGFKLSDNGLQGRMAFFKVSYKQTNSAGAYSTAPIVFAVRRTADQDNFIGLAFKGPTRAKWEFKIDPIGDIGAEVRESGQNKFAFIENSGGVKTFDHNGASLAWTGSIVNITGPTGIKAALKERGPLYTNEWDLFSVRSDTQVQFSFDGGPEFRITAVTEQQAESIAGKYTNLSMMALGVFSGRGVQDLRSITAFVSQGKSSWVVNESTGARSYSADSTSYAPDIFADTILDTENGIGKFAKSDGIDWNGVAAAKRFCKNNGLGCQLFMDGVIAEQTPWRQFWAETAPFSLLEFARVGGRETLIPAVPVNAAGVANREVIVNALFTAGNVLEGSYKEEFIDYGSAVQDLIATVIYRETESQDVFPRNSSVTVSLKGVNPSIAVSQSFDLSQFVTQRAQAILFAKLLCNQRRYIRRGIEFKTFPTDTPISPGAYIYVDIGLNTWERVSSGLIMQGGELNAPLLQGIPDGSYSVLAYQGNTAPVSFASVAVSNGIAASLAPYAGYMFVLGATTNRKRVFRVTEVQMDEEGEVTIKGMEHPCEDSGGKLLSRIADFSDSLFDVR
jgi:transcription elongation GreA/GreB family factor